MVSYDVSMIWSSCAHGMKDKRVERPFRVWFRILDLILLLARVCWTTCGSLQEAKVLLHTTAVSLQHPFS